MAWVAESNRAWATVKQQLPQLPPPTKYSNETWEYTIARDYWKQVAERGTMLIALGTEGRHEAPRPKASAASSKGDAVAAGASLWREEDEQVELLAAGIKALEQVSCLFYAKNRSFFLRILLIILTRSPSSL